MTEAAHAVHAHHVTPIRTLRNVFGGLVFLTLITVFSSRLELGVLNVPIALVIASGKAGLVVWFFMALKWDNHVNGVVLLLGALFVSIFLSFTLLDTAFRGDLSNVAKETVSDMERAAGSGELTGGEAAGYEVTSDTTAADTMAVDTIAVDTAVDTIAVDTAVDTTAGSPQPQN
jgi:cytochrome c oxidase subunit 4